MAEDDGVNLTQPPQEPGDFLWLMTEEPHRSRRMALMKKYPEVRLRHIHAVHDFNLSCHRRVGHETHGPRTPHKVGRAWCSFSTGCGGVLPQKHFYAIPRVLRPGLCDRWNREPEFVPRDP
jgi:hypothetical protein